MSQEYLASIVLLIGAVLKLFHVQIENQAIEGLVGGLLALWIAIRRYRRGDITLAGVRRD